MVRELNFHRGLNKASLDIIERAMFVVILDDCRCGVRASVV